MTDQEPVRPDYQKDKMNVKKCIKSQMLHPSTKLVKIFNFGKHNNVTLVLQCQILKYLINSNCLTSRHLQIYPLPAPVHTHPFPSYKSSVFEN